jgi:hypothetical protein
MQAVSSVPGTVLGARDAAVETATDPSFCPHGAYNK